MKNKLEDLNNHLFAQLERLGDEDLKGEDLEEEISRAKAINEVASQIISNGKLVIEIVKTQADYANSGGKIMPSILRNQFLIPMNDTHTANQDGKQDGNQDKKD